MQENIFCNSRSLLSLLSEPKAQSLDGVGRLAGEINIPDLEYHSVLMVRKPPLYDVAVVAL